MADIQLQDMSKQARQRTNDFQKEDGFENQPDIDKDYDPSHDKRDMYRLGKRQQLKRRFRYFSIAGYIIVLGNCWEFSIVTSAFSLANGGTGGAIWMTILVIFGVFLTVVSMAEVASMAPTAGGQYHWVSEIAPRGIQKHLSYAVGWFGLIAWQVSLSSCAYIFSNQILALIVVVKGPGFVPQGWQASLITILSSLTAVFLSVFIMQKLDMAEGLAVMAHVLGFVAFIAILWVMGPGPETSAYDVFFTFSDDNGWGSPGLAALVGLIGPIATFIGGDPAVHLAEELQDASYVLPRAMVSASGINYLIGLVALITFMFNIGPIDDSLYQYYGQPWIAVMYRITGSQAAVIVFIVIICINFYTLQVNSVMTSSRQLWAFARDDALPYSEWLARVDASGIPRNAVVVTMIVAVLLSLIVIGSTVAFNIILSISTAGAYACYIVILSTIIYRRFDGNDFPPTRFSLGRWGLPINIVSLMYLSLAFIFIFFPAAPDPSPVYMNWACLMFGALIMGAFSWYAFRARKYYVGPVEYVRRDVHEE